MSLEGYNSTINQSNQSINIYLLHSIETEFAHVQQWSLNNKLVINTSKTKEIIFWRSKKASSKYNLPLLNNIQRVNHVVLLGVTLESNLGWSIHIYQQYLISSHATFLFAQTIKIYVHERRCSGQCFRVTCHQPHQLCSPCFCP